MSKTTSERVAALAARIASGGDFKISEARAVAASALAQVQKREVAQPSAQENEQPAPKAG